MESNQFWKDTEEQARSPSDPKASKKYGGIGKTPLSFSPHQIFPGVNAGEDAFAEFVDKLVPRLDEALPQSARRGRVLQAPGVASSFGGNRSMQGEPHDPTGVAPWLTIGARELYGQDNPAFLATRATPTERSMTLLAWLLEACIPLEASEYRTRMRINTATSTGAPLMLKNEAGAAYTAEWLYRWNQPNTYAEMIARGDLSEMAQSGIHFMITPGARFQPEIYTRTPDGLVGKQRVVFAYEGKYVAADNSLSARYSAYIKSVMGACRYRKIAATPRWSLPLRAVCTKAHHWLIKRFKKVFIVRNPRELAQSFRVGYRYFVVDAPNHDVLLPWYVIAEICKRLAEVFSPVIALLFWALQTSPILVRSDSRGSTGRKVEGMPSNDRLASFFNSQTNGSGHPGTSLVAKIGGMLYMLLILDAAGVVFTGPQDIVALLDGVHPSGVQVANAGDNILFGIPANDADYFEEILFYPDTVRDDIMRLAAKGKIDPTNAHQVYAMFGEKMAANGHPHTIMKATDTFAGCVIYEDGGTFTAEANVITFILNEIAPGRSLDDPQRGWMPDGWDARYNYYSKYSKLVPRANAILEETFAEVFQEGFRDMILANQRTPTTDELRALIDYDPELIYKGRLDPDEIEAPTGKDEIILDPDEVERLAAAMMRAVDNVPECYTERPERAAA